MNTQVKEKICIYIPVKPYVYKYYMKKFHNKKNDAVKLDRGDIVYTFIQSRLAKPHDWYNRRYEGGNAKKFKLPIEIKDVDFRCCGFELSENDQRELATLLERKLQRDMLTWVGLRYFLGCKLQKTCEDWQQLYDIHEEDWQLESMRRMCTRAGLAKAKNDYKQYISTKLADILSHIQS